MSQPKTEITQLLKRHSNGEADALEELLPKVYEQLKRIAANKMKSENSGHTLQPTALVHEAYMRLVDQYNVDWRNRSQFMGVAARMMRRVLVNHAQAKGAAKRDQDEAIVEFPRIFDNQPVDVLALDIALDKLKLIDPLQERIVELRFFAGLTVDEVAGLLDMSESTVNREWAVAKLWLRRELAVRETASS